MNLIDHAIGRTEKWGFPPALADGVIKYGRKKPAYRGRTMHCFSNLRVITEGNVIITVWRD